MTRCANGGGLVALPLDLKATQSERQQGGERHDSSQRRRVRVDKFAIGCIVKAEAKHVFVSYVREDTERVDELCRVLEAAQVPYWRDRTSLAPGDAWKAKIRQAIRSGSLVFLACFSERSPAREKSHMNEELVIAVEEYRQMPPGRTWLIPVRFDAGDIPEWDLGAGRAISDLNYADLFGETYAPAAAALVTTIHRLMGDSQPNAATALAAVEQAVDTDRATLMKRLTKRCCSTPPDASNWTKSCLRRSSVSSPH